VSAARGTSSGPRRSGDHLFGESPLSPCVPPGNARDSAAAEASVEGLANRQRLQQVLETVTDITHGALLAPVGEPARDRLVAWGFPESSLERLDVGYFPDPTYVARELGRRGDLASEGEGAGLLDPTLSGRVVGPWRSRRGRILTLFAWEPERPDRFQRYAFGPWHRPHSLFGKHTALPLAMGNLCLVEGLFDVLLASCFGMDDVLAFGGPISRLPVRRLERLAASGVRELTVIPPDDEAGRLGVLTLLDDVDRTPGSALEVFVVDPALMAGAGDLGELVRKRGSQALMEVRASRMESNVYRLMLVPW
jgi:DNA primase